MPTLSICLYPTIFSWAAVILKQILFLCKIFSLLIIVSTTNINGETTKLLQVIRLLYRNMVKHLHTDTKNGVNHGTE